MTADLEIMEMSGNLGKKRKVKEKSGKFDRVSEPESSTTLQVQLNDQSYMKKSGKTLRSGEKSGKTKVKKVTTL